MFEKMTELLRKNQKSIVFPEGDDTRIQQAAVRLKNEKLLEPILLGDTKKVQECAEMAGIDIDGISVIDPVLFDRMDEMAQKMAELRKGKMSVEECAEALKKTNYFGTMLVKMNLADGLLGGATYSTADTVRPALQITKTKQGNKIVSSCMILVRKGADGKEERYAMADCAINPFPNEDEIVEIALETGRMAKLFGIEPRMALLSYSTLGSGKGESPEKMHNAAERLRRMNLDYPVAGELQFDAAIVPEVGALKAPGSEVAGHANTFIFPDINAANIGYKIAQRLGGFEALGPILMGLNAPINDLSRGTNTEEVYKMAIITAASAIR